MMRRRRTGASVVVVALALTPVLATSQTARPTQPWLSDRLPLEQYTASLSVGTPAGQLRRETQPRLAPVPPPDTRVVADRTISMPVIECPMPVVRPDTSVVRRMPVMRVPVGAPPVGVIRGCENPLASAR